ncbi:cellulose synthase-like protein G2 isoform X1 [Hibiscus syriacus]|uniref:cellulose synthase-like protein G2 isoform X1 n=1 Tax=Hibiscus syriacus TaxID=106335 RepID=UPI0019243D05|nr:cellulose synthase-like protein G2 isoform X1 [Hibiscus syriacus]
MASSSSSSLPLHICHGNKLTTIINRSHAVLHSIAIAFLIHYRVSFFFQDPKTRAAPAVPLVFVFASELLLSFIWFLGRAYDWNPVYRTVFPERLPSDEKLPPIDVFICTTDPNKEPTIGVMNTLLSAMALDYPPDKLSVYLSDDGGYAITLHAMREAWRFAKFWLPFCRRFDIETRCPDVYFSRTNDHHPESKNSDFIEEKQKTKEQYELFKERVRRAGEECKLKDKDVRSASNHPSCIEVIQEDSKEGLQEGEITEIPLLVYVSREKRTPHLHHFKAGAVNTLLRVSAVLSNSPYILMLDCDMYCNDPTSARQAMCFHFDPQMSPSLAFVQFPQAFHNISENDIYDSEVRSAYTIAWPGLDGLKGPVLSGTNFYIKREALCCHSIQKADIELRELKDSFGPSNEFIKSIQRDYNKPNLNGDEVSNMLLKEAKVLASCSYENHTKWGKEVGFLYDAVAEDYLTGFVMQCNGWTSAYVAPSSTRRPQFLGTSTTNVNELLTQGIRWGAGLVDVAISRFSPLLYGPPRTSFLHSMGYAELSLFPLLYCLPLWCFATIPPLYLLNGVPLYPEVSDPYFSVFLLIFLSSLSKHLHEVLKSGRPIRKWINEQRIWMIKSVTCHLYGSLDAILKKLGLRKASFMTTNKVADDDQIELYREGKFDFRASTIFIVPLVTIMLVNLASVAGGIWRMLFMGGDWKKMLGQVLLSVYIIVMNYVVIEGMVIRRDKGRIPLHVSVLSFVFCLIFLLLGSLISNSLF